MQDWQRSVIYQIYPKSFHSHQGQATGDLLGVVDKLDYLHWLGVDCLWLTPFLRSPQRDNGYDISDYYAIDPSYGSMADCELLIAEAGKRGIKLMLDIVVNHTSIEHAWFQQARSSLDNPYRDFYIWRDEPNNWESKFGGSAWEYEAQTGQYYLHLFDHTQADLNWDNPRVRAEVFKMMRFWRDKGVGGFRLDVINLISKPADFPEDQSDGRRFYTDGPNVHEYLQEMHREVFAGHDLVNVGEMSSTRLEHCIRYSNPESKELSMTFNFHHLKVDYPNQQKWLRADFDFLELKRILSDWQTGMQAGGGWNALFWCNHDQPRVVSRFGDDGEHRVVSAKMLATALHLLQGTPFVYQGEELGMTNPHFQRIEQYRDVETLNIYRLKREAGEEPQAIMAAIQQKSRDNGRTPMQWSAGANAGFSSGTPWIEVAANAGQINVQAQLDDPQSVLHHYRQLIALRREQGLIQHGVYRQLLPEHPQVWAYVREGQGERLLVVNNFYGSPCEVELPQEVIEPGMQQRLLISNYPGDGARSRHLRLRPYESFVLHLTDC
ncbi:MULTISPECIES: alpha,alpha-phosphotrehalase [unclassified Pseudomonas]|uniref:alpha,alpha-phosphotrehalase n=1 Tax=Pseudomonas TaxID=286 RepID=UPI0008768073|nr:MULTISPECIES: alpha,alpha-phosphotrehalase [unclassified Pseudomonas]SCZ60572.1 trehalose-6-phosphate hydrolase [Pseudomonas sp. NFPP17]SDA54731.1 trehalose-6-phosphate hydrolase [Pseudomonas sp. NFPP15]SEK80989.1 trehalose-6-phosphate hydrolase [Pseudomonas sp. NFPP18]SFA53138.1 trehalose-6-phosphate hydrolase [Pseudomonas sp. NFPP13]SFT62165.1 trehalose-6-phosphate hydrolase [Pseudomonas sp. NFPP25]